MHDIDRLVCYSVAITAGSDRLLWQLALSLATLRRHNGHTPVVVFVYGAVPAELARICARYGAVLEQRGEYGQRLARSCPQGWQVLQHYPLLHKFLNHDWLARTGARQVLLCDCDTIFAGDPEQLFDRYREADLVAREEVHTFRSRYGPEPDFLDEPALGRLAQSMGVRRVPPFNTGVVLLNNRVWEQLSLLDDWYLRCAWHLVLWLSLHPGHAEGTNFGTIDAFADAARLAGPAELRRALPLPSKNQWILDEIAMWLSLGALPAMSTADFRATDVAQNGEFAGSTPDSAEWVLCHYFSSSGDAVAEWLRDELVQRS